MRAEKDQKLTGLLAMFKNDVDRVAQILTHSCNLSPC
ncbi:conserved hypothetical protein [Vibrio cholerae O1 str. 2010EL-1786]|uniref:Uncharacterized protein n=2 Tax=Vibrio cholerae TaxID=666 RepID=Q9KQ35_VIBCH|nr:hypothetical protein VC_2169 [Vibrio cholerae O1 biovar El Tor str. N16961]ACP06394.1 conserved hypothetical protein [Vibrio cholerae M66-2]ACP10275.1 conserved hypothetical protein [Vibrio cholerae O395]AET27256.1 conserved hypothetical protein [Vibrio cholerae O1 str. 2010EL-1786]EEO06051.1 hypothetical protein VIF_002666 [Vibrio cholerae TM 11079-80]CSB92818.1 Uncharacterised protein [Vibrio cholerae]